MGAPKSSTTADSCGSIGLRDVVLDRLLGVLKLRETSGHDLHDIVVGGNESCVDYLLHVLLQLVESAGADVSDHSLGLVPSLSRKQVTYSFLSER